MNVCASLSTNLIKYIPQFDSSTNYTQIMPVSICSGSIWCSAGSSATSSTESSVSSTGEIIGIVIGSLIGLAFLICIIVTIYMVCCKPKAQMQVWAYPDAGSQTYGQSMAMYPYPHYFPHGPMQQPQPIKIIDEPPPAYEEITTAGVSANST